MVELLAPAGSLDSLRAAVNAGADAVYIGGSLFGARAYADNPDEEHLIRGIEYCHLHGRKLYMTVNTLLKERELETMLYPFLLPYYRSGLDGVIVQDLGVMRFLQEYFPGLDIHASTQMTVTSPYGARLLRDQGITRVVPARELSLKEVRRIIDETGMEVETFIHGAMCYCYSGQCLLSSMLGGRSGNRGRCAQPCRLPYSVSGSPKSCLLSMKDMCTLELLPELIDGGIASFKIEGRMKRPEYTAGVVSIYRKYIDLYLEKGRRSYKISEEDRLRLLDLYNRGGFSQGYYKHSNGRDMMSMLRPNHQGTKAARIISASRGDIRAEALEALQCRDVLELPDGSETTFSREIKKGEVFSLRIGSARAKKGDLLFRTKNETLLEELRQQYTDILLQEKIKGELRIFPGTPVILNLWCRDHFVTVSGEIPQPARSNPIPEELVRRQMQKTGGTPFVFEELAIHMEGELFVTVKELNELRRRGLLALEEEILSGFRRELTGDAGSGIPVHSFPETSTGSAPAKPSSPSVNALYKPVPGKADAQANASLNMQRECCQGRYKMNVLVTTLEQLDAVLSFTEPVIDTVYIDSLLLGFCGRTEEESRELERRIDAVKAAGWRCFLSFTPVFREADQRLFCDRRILKLLDKMDGFLLHTADQLAYAGKVLAGPGREKALAVDDTLYAYNNRAAHFLEGLGITRRTLPAELNFRELAALDRRDSELNVYGYQALMQSAQCVTKNTSGCTGVPKLLYLSDRKKAEFPVLNRCPVCCNTIYNSVPLQLGGCREEILALSPEFLRLTFTVEDGKTTKRILEQYYGLLFTGSVKGPGPEGTRGHFKRGVE